jgi:hypothetical protein
MENEILKAGMPLTPASTAVEPDVCTEYAGAAVVMPRSGDERGMTKTGEVKNPKFHTNESEKLPADIAFRNGK